MLDAPAVPVTLDVGDDLSGHIDTIRLDGDALVVRGWAWSPQNPERRVALAIVYEGQTIHEVVADELRGDLAEAEVGDGAHAFQCRIADAAAYSPGAIRVYCPDADKDLPCSGATEISAELMRAWPPAHRVGPDHVSGLSCAGGVVRGWYDLYNRQASGGSDGKANYLTILTDGEIVWSGHARRRERVRLGETFQETQTGFLVELPEPAHRARYREVAILRSERQHLAGSPFQVVYGDHFVGLVEQIVVSKAAVTIRGWCINLRAFAKPVPITVMSGDQEVFQTQADLPRPDLKSSGYDTTIGGFTINLDHSKLEDPASLAVLPGKSGWPLPKADAAYREESSSSDGNPRQIYCIASDHIDGTVDVVTPRQVRGWARNKTNPEAVVVLDLFLNGVLYATTIARRFRADLKKHFSDHGCHEYLFEISPTAIIDSPCTLEVEPRVGSNAIKNKHPIFERALAPSKIIAPRERDFLMPYRWHRQAGGRLPNKVALIIVNRNGNDLLGAFFSSFHRVNTYASPEILVVDHGSTDESETVCREWATRLPIKWLPRHSNYSFSQSCNYGSSNTDADILVFINNDIVFTMDTLRRIVDYMADPAIGILGIRLMDDSPVRRKDRQYAIQHLGVLFDEIAGSPSGAYEARFASTWEVLSNDAIEVPCVTGAYLVCRRSDFLDLGGFDERFFYGHEDVDLCLKFRATGRSVVCANDIWALHARAVSRDRMTPGQLVARQRNRAILDERFGRWFRRALARDRFDRVGFWSGLPIRIAFVVTEATESTLAGDYFTALELAAQLSARYPCECLFLETLAGNQYDLTGIDVVVAMLDGYDPAQIKNPTPHLIKIAWVRNWFERFAMRAGAPLFDRIWASSESAASHIEGALGKPVMLLPIATNIYRFEAGKRDSKLACDYCFTGSYWGIHREIISLLQPSALPFTFAIFGVGWENVPHLASFSQGPLPYRRMPDVYASTRIVIDDANHVTKEWGAVNSRVFDAIAAGVLILTNGIKGSASLFGNALPTFETAQELESLLWLYLGDEKKRVKKVRELQKIVRTKHTYQLRAQTVWLDIARVSRSQIRFSIKIGAPNEKSKLEWGDWHYAVAMKRELERLGHTARIDCIDGWEQQAAAGDEVVIVLRGLTSYRPKLHQLNLLWCISHPDSVSDREIDSYDHVFVASAKHATELQERFGDKISVLLQCTDAERFNPMVPSLDQRPAVLFVGNSRNEYRHIVREAVKAGLPLEVYGSRWEGYLPDHLIKGQYVDNSALGSFYKSASVVLNDHWATMASYGYISNRVFDAAACGAKIITDDVPGLRDVFGDVVHIFRPGDDLSRLIASVETESQRSQKARLELAAHIIEHHSFHSRVQSIMKIVERSREMHAAAFASGAAFKDSVVTDAS